MTRMHRVADRVLGAFTDWFTSKGGVWQTALVTLAVVVIELSNRGLDPHAFLLMAVLTVYSAITQPALAYSGRVSGERLERMETQLADHIERVERLLDERPTYHWRDPRREQG